MDIFKQYVYESIEYEKCIDSKILKDVFTGKNSSNLIFAQNPELNIEYALADKNKKMRSQNKKYYHVIFRTK